MDEKPTTRRRWLSFNLRSLFVCVTLLAVGTAWLANERNQSRRELQVVEMLGDNVDDSYVAGLFEGKRKAWMMCGLGNIEPEPPAWKKSLGDLLGLRVRELSLYRMQSGDLASLAELRVSNNSISNKPRSRT